MANLISGNAGAAQVQVVLSGTATAVATSGSSGNYSFTGLAAGNYFITCHDERFQFSPYSSAQTIVSTDITGVNFTTSSAPALTQVWEKQGIVIPIVVGGTFGVFEPSVIYEGNAQILSGNVFKMWYYNGSSSPNTGMWYAESVDGITWSQYSGNPIIADQTNGLVFKNVGTYYMYPIPGFGMPQTSFSQYTSSDGVHWTLANSNVLSPGAAGAWDNNQMFGMSVVDIVGGTWRALYGATQTANNSLNVGLATSPDGVTWTKYAGNPVLQNFTSQNVVKINGKYYAWGDSTQYNLGGSYPFEFPTDFYRTSSTDLISWTTPIRSIRRTLAFEGVGIATSQLDTPAVLEVNGKSYMFYGGSPAALNTWAMGLATSNQTLAQLVTLNDAGGDPIQWTSDNFQRANENPLSDAGNWAQLDINNMQLSSHVAIGTVAAAKNGVAWTGMTWANDHYSEVTAGTGFAAGAGLNFIYPMCRMGGTKAAPTFYVAYVRNDGNVYVERLVSGTATELGATPSVVITVADGDVYRLQVTGTAIQFFQNGNLKFEVADSAITSGSAGFGSQAAATLSLAPISLWAGGQLGFSISGNAGAPGVTISWTGPTSGSVVSDSLGNYTTSQGLVNGSYTLTPSKTGLTFSPTTSNQTITGTSITGVNFSVVGGGTAPWYLSENSQIDVVKRHRGF